MATDSNHDRLLMGSPLRRPHVCQIIGAMLVAVLVVATLINLHVLGSLRPDVIGVFWRALSLSSLLRASSEGGVRSRTG